MTMIEEECAHMGYPTQAARDVSIANRKLPPLEHMTEDEIDLVRDYRAGKFKPLTITEREVLQQIRTGSHTLVSFREFHQIASAPTESKLEWSDYQAGATVEPPDLLAAWMEREWEWSQRTFGPALRTKGILEHIRKELGEIEKSPFDLVEWIDIIILALDGYKRHGGDPRMIMRVLDWKQAKIFARVWPDWRDHSEDEAIEHDRSED